MPQPACASFVEAIQQCAQDLSAVDEQLRGLEGEGMNQLNPGRYFALQPQVDRLITKKHALQDAWNRAMTELGICTISPRFIDPDRPDLIGEVPRTPCEAFEKGLPSMYATAIVQAAIQAWEEHDANALASYLSEDILCKHILPQAIGKAQLLAFMKAITTAFPDWSFNGHVLHEKSLAEHSWSVLFVTAVTGSQTADLIFFCQSIHFCDYHQEAKEVEGS